MSSTFDKDRWIKDAIAARYIVPKEDGTIYRLRKIDGVTGRRTYVKVKTSIHRKTGRVYFNLEWAGFRKSVLVNRVIGLAFLPNPDGLPEVNHIDGNKQHNAVKNLEWSDRDEQEKHAQAQGLKTGRGSQNANARLNAEKVREIRRLARDGADYNEIAKSFDVAPSTVRQVVNRQTWAHV